MSKTDVLYRFALDCALHTAHGTCNFNCNSCNSNLDQYSITDEERTILRHTAKLDVDERLKSALELKRMEQVERARNRGSVWPCLIVLALCGFVLGWFFAKCESIKKEYFSEIPSQSIEAPSAGSRLSAIPDVNGDGKVNCVDTTLYFYENFKGFESMRIMHGKKGKDDPKTHLWIRLNGVDIEPFVTLDQFWGAGRWINATDVTENYYVIKTGQMNWKKVYDADYRHSMSTQVLDPWGFGDPDWSIFDVEDE